MRHFTTMVVLPREPKDRDDLDEMLSLALAPFDEDREVERYKDHEDPLPEDWRERLPAYSKATRAMDSLRPEGKRVPDEQSEAWEICRDLRRANDIPWPYSALLLEDESEPPNLGDLALVAKLLNERWGDACEADDKGLYRWTTYNPQSKWDYWRLGGRWRGYFHIPAEAAGFRAEPGWDSPDAVSPTPGFRPADACRKGDIAAEAMTRSAAIRAEDAWAEAQARPEAAGFVYDVQEGETREGYVARMSAIATLLKPFAVLRGGEWFEAGRMGWFGCDSSDEDSRKTYADWFAAFWSDLPDDTWVAICDLHI